jgi:hypothetical protein
MLKTGDVMQPRRLMSEENTGGQKCSEILF